MHNLASKPKCNICGKSFSTKKYTLKHMRMIHKNIRPKIKCYFCVKTFTSNSHMKRHAYCTHIQEEVPVNESKYTNYECDICCSIYTNVYELKRHVFAHYESNFEPKNMHCPSCKKTFKQNGNLNRHILEVHEKVLVYHECGLCHKTFTNKRNLKRHHKMEPHLRT